MRVTEQIDALEVMSVNVSTYLVLPKILGCSYHSSLNYLCTAFAIIGGMLASSMAGHVSSMTSFMVHKTL